MNTQPEHGWALIATTRNEDGDVICINRHTSAYVGHFPVIEYEVGIVNQDGTSAGMFFTPAQLRVLLKTIEGKL